MKGGAKMINQKEKLNEWANVLKNLEDIADMSTDRRIVVCQECIERSVD